MISSLGVSKELKLKQKQSPSLTVNSMAGTFVLLISTEQLTPFYCIFVLEAPPVGVYLRPWQENNWTNKCISKIVWKCFCCIPPHPVFGHELKSRFLVCWQLSSCWLQLVEPGQGKSPLQCLPKITGTLSHFSFVQLSVVFSQWVCVCVILQST